MLRPGKRIHNGTRIQLHNLKGTPTDYWMTAIDKNETGKYLLQLPDSADVFQLLSEIGETPLPPYIERNPADTMADRERYQTVYANRKAPWPPPRPGCISPDRSSII